MGENAKLVAQYLDDLGLDWYYEYPVFVLDNKNRGRMWTPDFYLPVLQMYIEVFGTKDVDYWYREQIYEKNNVPVVFLSCCSSDKRWQERLLKRIVELENSDPEKKNRGLGMLSLNE